VFGGLFLESGSIDLLQNIESIELDSRLVYFVDVIFFLSFFSFFFREIVVCVCQRKKLWKSIAKNLVIFVI